MLGLELERVGVHDNVFALGGHSLHAMQVIARLLDVLEVDFTLQQFFAAPTIAGLAPALEIALLRHLPVAMGKVGETQGKPCA